MTREQAIQILLKEFFQNPVPNIKDWRSVLNQMTDDELFTLVDIQRKEEGGVLVKDDLNPFIQIMAKYFPGSTPIIAEHYPADDPPEDERGICN